MDCSIVPTIGDLGAPPVPGPGAPVDASQLDAAAVFAALLEQLEAGGAPSGDDRSGPRGYDGKIVGASGEPDLPDDEDADESADAGDPASPPLEAWWTPAPHETPFVPHQTPPVPHKAPPVPHETPPVPHETPPVPHETPPVPHEAPPTSPPEVGEEATTAIASDVEAIVTNQAEVFGVGRDDQSTRVAAPRAGQDVRPLDLGGTPIEPSPSVKLVGSSNLDPIGNGPIDQNNGRAESWHPDGLTASTPSDGAPPRMTRPLSEAGRALARALSALRPLDSPSAPTDVPATPPTSPQQAGATESRQMPAVSERMITDAVPPTYAMPNGRGTATTFDRGVPVSASPAPFPDAGGTPTGGRAAGDSTTGDRGFQFAEPSTFVPRDGRVPYGADPSPAQTFEAILRDDRAQVPRIGQERVTGNTPASPTGEDQHDVAGQLVNAIRLQIRDGVGEAKVRLRPEHMGDVDIEIRVERDRVTATLHVERPDVRAQVESQSQSLRAALAAQGLQLDELTVRDDERPRDDQRQGERQPDRRQRRGQPERRFELDE